MKIIVQNGSKHPISRSEMEAIVKLLPQKLLKGVSSITLCSSNNQEPHVTHHPKESSIGLHATTENTSPSIKIAALQTLVASLAAISEHGQLPNKVSQSKQQQYLASYNSVLNQCTQVFSNATT